MLYFLLKIIHIISASLFIGALFGNFYFTYYFRKSLSRDFFKRLMRYDLNIGLITLLLQPISGFAIIAIQSYYPLSRWILETLGFYAMIGCLWFVGLFQQQRLLYQLENALPTQLKSYLYYRSSLLLANLSSLFVLYYLMIHRPV